VVDDTLARLLTTEGRLAARLDAARAEAEGIVGEAREDALRTEAACAATIETRIATLVTEHEARLAMELETIRRDAAQLVSRFDAVDAARTRSHVTHIIARLLRGEPDRASEQSP
jgi:vacuolar-type H+-ATPase subunit H